MIELRRSARFEREMRRRLNPLRLHASRFESEFNLPPGCLRRFDDLAAGFQSANRQNRRLDGTPTRSVARARNLTDSGSVSAIAALRWPSSEDMSMYLRNMGSAMQAGPGRPSTSQLVLLVWAVLADVLCAESAFWVQIDLRLPRPLRLHV